MSLGPPGPGIRDAIWYTSRMNSEFDASMRLRQAVDDPGLCETEFHKVRAFYDRFWASRVELQDPEISKP